MTDLAVAEAAVHRGESRAWSSFYLSLLSAARRVCSKKGLFGDLGEETAHSMATQIVQRYNRNPTYSVKAWSHLLRCEFMHAVAERGHDKELKRREAEKLYSMAQQNGEPAPMDDPTTYIYVLLRDHEKGQEIVVNLVRGRSYRAGVLAVEAIAGRDWVYKHAVELRFVWMLTRRGRGEKDHDGDNHRSAGVGCRKGSLSEIRPDTERDHQRDPGRIRGNGRIAAAGSCEPIQAVRLEAAGCDRAPTAGILRDGGAQ